MIGAVNQTTEISEEPKKETKKKQSKRVRILKWSGFTVLMLFLIALITNAFLCLFKDHYYPTFGGYRLFAIVSDSMDPTIPEGHMIVGK